MKLLRTRRHHTVAIALAVATVFSTAPASAELYKWVDERGVTTYSDKKPDDPKSSDKVKEVAGNLSVYSPDKSLLQAVEVARVRANQPPAPEPYRAPPVYAVPMNPQQPVEYDPCVYGDCGYYYPVAGYPFRRRPVHHLGQPILPPGATAGTVNSPGIIPGNTGTQFGVPTMPTNGPVQREPARPRAQPLDQRFR